MTYPKWVSRGYGLGEILCLDEAEERAVHADLAARAIGSVTEATAAINREYENTLRKKPGPKPKVQ